MKKWQFALLIGLTVSIICSMVTFAKECDNIRQQVLRLHVIANSDTPQDQALKLKVRDRIVEEGAGMLDSAQSEADAADISRLHIDRFKEVAEEVIRQEGYEYSVQVEVADSFFDTRVYQQVTLPAGWYEAVRVVIGEGKGQNWWCVMFPPMCIPAAEESAALDRVLSGEEMDIVENGQKYEIKFKSVEIFENIKQTVANWFEN